MTFTACQAVGHILHHFVPFLSYISTKPLVTSLKCENIDATTQAVSTQGQMFVEKETNAQTFCFTRSNFH